MMVLQPAKPAARDAQQAQMLIAAIRAALAAEQANTFAGHRYAPGAYAPSEEDERFLFDIDEEPVNAAAAAPTILSIVPSQPRVEVPATRLPPPPPEFRLPDLLAFVASLEERPSDEGIADLALRRAARGLPSLLPIITAVSNGDLGRAQELATVLATAHRSFAQAAQVRLNEVEAAPRAVYDPVAAVEQLALKRLDEILTASALRLQGDLMKLGTEAHAKHKRVGELAIAFDANRSNLLVRANSYPTTVGRLAMARQKRQDLTELVAAFDALDREVAGYEAALLAAEAEASNIDQAFRNLEDRYFPLRESAEELLRSLRQLITAAQTLGVALPESVTSQIANTMDPLKRELALCSQHFEPLPLPSRDEKLATALAEIEAQRKRKRHEEHPIRASVFKTPLDREEELRRLTMITLHVFVLAQPDRAVAGRGKGTLVGTLIEADLIDETEHDNVLSALRAFREAKPRLVEPTQRGKYWLYKPSSDGLPFAREWLDGCLEPRELIDRIESARVRYGIQYRAQKRARKELE